MLILIFCRKYLKCFFNIILSKHRTNLFTKTTVYTQCNINLRIKKSFFILMHNYTLFGTTLHTSITTTTFTFIGNLQHSYFLMFFFNIKKTLSLKNIRSLFVRPNTIQHKDVQKTETAPLTKKRIIPSSI